LAAVKLSIHVEVWESVGGFEKARHGGEIVRKPLALVSCLFVLPIILSACGGVSTQEYSELLEQYNAAQTELEKLNEEYTSTQDKLGDRIAQLESELRDAKSDYQRMLEQNRELRDEVSQYVDMFGYLSNSVYKRVLDDKLSLSIAYATSQRGVLSSLVAGGNGDLIVLIDNADSKDVTYTELLSFLAADPTSSSVYSPFSVSGMSMVIGDPWERIDISYYEQYVETMSVGGRPSPRTSLMVCSDIAQMLHNNAELKGIRSFYVNLTFTKKRNVEHAVVAFNTTDKGLVFIDSSGGLDAIANITIGEKVTFSPIHSSANLEPLPVVSFVHILTGPR